MRRGEWDKEGKRGREGERGKEERDGERGEKREVERGREREREEERGRERKRERETHADYFLFDSLTSFFHERGKRQISSSSSSMSFDIIKIRLKLSHAKKLQIRTYFMNLTL